MSQEESAAAQSGRKGFSAFSLAGAFCAFCIGSGFASGQEVMQFFTAYGIWSFGALAISMVLFMWLGSSIMRAGHDLQLTNTSEVFKYYCGPYLGIIFEFFVPFFLFAVFVIMIAGAGAIMAQHYGFNPYVGRVIMAGVSLVTVVFGLRRMVSVIGAIGPMIIAVAICTGVLGIMNARHSLATIDTILSTVEVPSASSSWWIAGLLYAGFMIFGSAPFFAGLGCSAKDKGTASNGGLLGGFMLMGAAGIMSTGMLLNIDMVYALEVPALAVADTASPVFTSLFAIILLLGVYTTAAPMLWTVCNRITPDDSKMFKPLASGLTVAAFVGALLPFGQLVGTIYPFTGYFGCLFMVCVVLKQIGVTKK